MTERSSDHRPDLEAFLRLDDEALEAALDARFGDEGDEASTAAFAATCREALAPELGAPTGDLADRGSDALREKRVAERVLARSTREDLRRRADIGLVVDFVAERLRHSALLRVAAALLLVQLTVVPLVALHLASEPDDRGLQFRLEPAPEVFESLPERDEEAVVGGSAELDEPVLADTFVGDLIASLPADLATGARTPVGRSLAGLEAVVRGADQLAPRDGGGTVAVWADLEARLLLWRDRGRSAGLARAIDDACVAFEEAGTDGQLLIGLALRRAASMHLAVADLPDAPIEGDWREALSRVLEDVDDPMAARWRRALGR